MPKRALLSACLAALLLLLQPQPVAANAVISLGTPFITITADTFAVPIEITGGVDVTGWSFGLNYDPQDWTINTSCDPFTDIYCSLLTGPITEGAFFGSLSPFNTFNPGFILLDAVTSAQLGQLIAVNDTFGGSLPGPSGAGVLAYVEFVMTPGGTGESTIELTDPSVTSSTVPEPATLALLAAGLLLLVARHMKQVQA